MGLVINLHDTGIRGKISVVLSGWVLTHIFEYFVLLIVVLINVEHFLETVIFIVFNLINLIYLLICIMKNIV